MQSNLTRALVALAAIAVVVVAFFVLKEDEESGEGSSNGAATAGQATAGQTTDDSKPAGFEKRKKAEKPEEPVVPEIVVEGGAIEGGPADLAFQKGDEVRFVVRSDVEDEVHVHGYDISAEVPAGGKAEFEFPAELEGVFEIELENSATPLAELTVTP